MTTDIDIAPTTSAAPTDGAPSAEGPAPAEGPTLAEGPALTEGSAPTADPAPSEGSAPTAGTAADLGLAFAWEHGPGERDLGDRDTVFRFPAVDDPEPATRRLLGMSLYATLLGLIGLAIGIRGLVAIVAERTPGWYEPALAGSGLLCVALVTAAFLAIHRRWLPWVLLITATAPLAANIMATRAL